MKIKFFSGENLLALEESVNIWLDIHLHSFPGIQIFSWQLSAQGDRQVLSVLFQGGDRFKPYGLGSEAGN